MQRHKRFSWLPQFCINIEPGECKATIMQSVSVDTREAKHLWLAQTAETRMTTTCPWILAPRHSALPRLTVLRISTSRWAQGPITLTSQDSLQRYLPVRGAAPPCATGPVATVMSPRRPSTATSNLTGNVSFWQLSSHSDRHDSITFFFPNWASARFALLIICAKRMTFIDLAIWNCFFTAKPTPLDLKNNGIIDELPFKSPVTMSWTRPMWVSYIIQAG